MAFNSLSEEKIQLPPLVRGNKVRLLHKIDNFDLENKECENPLGLREYKVCECRIEMEGVNFLLGLREYEMEMRV